MVFSTSALTPTMASVPSAKHIRALPLVAGRMSVSATKGRNWVAVRPSGRTGGVRDNEVWRYESSAGERSVVVVEGGMALGSTRNQLRRKRADNCDSRILIVEPGPFWSQTLDSASNGTWYGGIFFW